MALHIEFQIDQTEIDEFAALSKPTKTRRSGAARLRPLAERIRDVSFSSSLMLLMMPVRLSVDYSDLFDCGKIQHTRILSIHDPGPTPMPRGHTPCVWAWLPIVDLATLGLKATEKLTAQFESGLVMYEVGGIYFGRKSNGVEIAWIADPTGRGPVTRTVTVASVKELQSQWLAFSERVRTTLLELVPELSFNRELGGWFVHGREYLHELQ